MELYFQKITSEINKIVAEGSTVSLTNITIIPSGLKEQLDKFAKSGIADINFTQYDEVVSFLIKYSSGIDFY